ncbi:MAG: aminopeptidase P family protein [Lachnospiraceae bacterium]|nr:aminopeptidase P family protein [Lachnospiraceae bacterium]
MIKKRIELLYQAMEKRSLDAYIITMGDHHGSEYISEYFNLIKYYSSFSGSAGTLVFSKNNNGERVSALFTDGRYYLQATDQLKGTGIGLMKYGMPGVPGVSEYIAKLAEEKKDEFRAGFDGRIVEASLCLEIEKEAKKCGAAVLFDDEDIAGRLWDEDPDAVREKIPSGNIWMLKESYSGMSAGEKLELVRSRMEEKGASLLILTALDEIAYLLNLRGNDVEYNPVFMSFMIIGSDKASLYTDAKLIKESINGSEDIFRKTHDFTDISGHLKENGADISVKPYFGFFDDIAKIQEDEKVWLFSKNVSEFVYETVSKKSSSVIDAPSPVVMMKAMKNETETENMKQAHIRDGVAVTKWIYAMKQAFGTSGSAEEKELTEISAAQLLDSKRREGAHYIGQSFAPIMAFAEHGAIVHYEADKDSDKKIVPGSGALLLADTGGHYLEGTTDITRTISLGEPDDEIKSLYTAVLKGHLRLLDTCFPEGISGQALDHIAREPLYEMGLDYRHGTGHGVGYLLNVHEGPCNISKRHTKFNKMMEGMITSDEPGVYLEGRFGIRLESLLLTVFDRETEYGRFMRFEPLTMVPFDKSCIKVSDLSEKEKQIINAYHKKVCDTISPFLDEEEQKWLADQTAGV